VRGISRLAEELSCSMDFRSLSNISALGTWLYKHGVTKRPGEENLTFNSFLSFFLFLSFFFLSFFYLSFSFFLSFSFLFSLSFFYIFLSSFLPSFLFLFLSSFFLSFFIFSFILSLSHSLFLFLFGLYSNWTTSVLPPQLL
jgi:hypothetical protein